MTPMTDVDRIVASWLEAAGPTDIRGEIVEHALRTARTTRRLGSIEAFLRGSTAWPLGRADVLIPSASVLRLGLAGLLVVVLLGAMVAVAGRFPPPAPIVRPTFPPPPADAIERYAGVFRVVAENGHGDTLATLPSGRVLLASGDWRGNSLIELDLETGRYVDTGTRLSSRRASQPTAVPLTDGRVLLIGGDMTEPDAQGVSGPAATTAEIYLPATHELTRTGELVHETAWPGIVALPDGRVLVVGGYLPNREDTVPLDTAETFDPVTGTFTATGRMHRPRAFPQVVVLADGRVLVVGGESDGNVGPSSELFDPVTGTFAMAGSARPVPAPITPTRWPIAARGRLVALQDGRAALLGVNCQEESGSQDAEPAITDLFDPTIGTFSEGPLMPHCVEHAFALPNGEVFVAGYFRGPGDTAYWSGLFDPRSGTVRVTQPPTGGPYLHTMQLPDGRVLAYNEVDADIRVFE